MKLPRFFVMLFLCGCLAACATPFQKRNIAINEGVYAIRTSLAAGRFDLATKYSNELSRIVPSPARPIKINAVEAKNPEGLLTKYVVIPKEFQDTPVMTVGSKDFNNLLDKNPPLKAQLEEENKSFAKFESKIDDSILSTQKEADKPKSKSGIWGWGASIIGGLGVVGIGVACVFFPALIPLLLSIFGRIRDVANYLLAALTRILKK